jgi:hypothetical protein
MMEEVLIKTDSVNVRILELQEGQELWQAQRPSLIIMFTEVLTAPLNCRNVLLSAGSDEGCTHE